MRDQLKGSGRKFFHVEGVPLGSWGANQASTLSPPSTKCEKKWCLLLGGGSPSNHYYLFYFFNPSLHNAGQKAWVTCLYFLFWHALHIYFIGLGYNEFYNGKFIPTDRNYSNEEIEEIFRKSYNENYYLLDATGTFTCDPLDWVFSFTLRVKIFTHILIDSHLKLLIVDRL